MRGADEQPGSMFQLCVGGLGGRRCTVAADKGYDSRDFIAQLRAMGTTAAETAAPWRAPRDVGLTFAAAAYNIVRLRRLLPAAV